MKKHAYLIIAHNNFSQLARLCQFLDDVRNDIYIHIDASAGALPVAEIGELKNAGLFFTDRVSVSWGGLSMINAELILLESALNSGNEYQYYHLISGVDVPLKTNDAICEFFDKNNGKEFLHFCDEGFTRSSAVVDRARYYRLFRERIGRKTSGPLYYAERVLLKLQKLLKVNRLKDTALYCGSQWFSITHSFAEYLVSQKDWIYKTFSHSVIPDELVLQTLAMNSPFKEKLYRTIEDGDCRGNMRLIDWQRGNPYTWTSRDYDELVESEFLFARKFDSTADAEVIDKIYCFLKDNIK